MGERIQTIKDNAKEKALRVKEHVSEHKTKYIIAGGAVVCVATGVVIYRLNKNLAESNELLGRIENSVRATINNPTINGNVNAPLIYTDYNVTVESFSPRANPVKRLSDGKVWASQYQAAMENGGLPGNLSKHLNGKMPHFMGEQFANVPYDEFVGASQ